MSISQMIGPQLPYLRRFARALSGSQDSGDAYVVAMLEALLSDSSLLPEGMEPRAALYRAFLKVWNSVQVNGEADPPPMSAADRRLEAVSPRPRQAFLLVAVENFTTPDAALVLDCTEAEVRRMIERASREIAEQVRTNVLIIEDEPMIALDLSDLVGRLGHDVVDVARTHREAVVAFKRHRPGLVLADIQLADGSSGIDAVNEILGSFDVPVIFITAYPERLLTETRPEPTFLINKPFRPESVQAIISQALFFDTKAHLPVRARASG